MLSSARELFDIMRYGLFSGSSDMYSGRRHNFHRWVQCRGFALSLLWLEAFWRSNVGIRLKLPGLGEKKETLAATSGLDPNRKDTAELTGHLNRHVHFSCLHLNRHSAPTPPCTLPPRVATLCIYHSLTPCRHRIH